MITVFLSRWWPLVIAVIFLGFGLLLGWLWGRAGRDKASYRGGFVDGQAAARRVDVSTGRTELIPGLTARTIVMPRQQGGRS